MNDLVRLLLPALLLVGLLPARAQTVYAGETIIDKKTLPGLFLTIQGDGRQIEKDWADRLKSYGRLTNSRGTYRVPNANIPNLSSEPTNVVSTVKSTRTSATIFAAFDQGSGNYVTAGSSAFPAAQQVLTEFAGRTSFSQEARTAENGLDEAQRNHQRLVRQGEKLQRDMEQNAKEKERLQKRLEDNAKELEQLIKDVETNKTDQASALTEVENRRRNVEAVRAKQPK